MLHYLAWLSASCTDYVTLPKIWTHVECKITDAIRVAEQHFTLVTSVYPTISEKPNLPRSFSFLKHIYIMHVQLELLNTYLKDFDDYGSLTVIQIRLCLSVITSSNR